MNKRARIIGLIVIVGVLALVVWREQAAAPAAKPPAATVAYSCNAGKGIVAAYYQGETKPSLSPGQPPTPGGHVALTFSDGSEITLAQTVSADGARYANSDESLVFWGKGNAALVLVGGQEKVYTGCIAIAPEPPGTSLPATYSNSAAGFSLRLPQGYAVDEAYKYQQLGPGKDIFGIKFTIPQSMATGTNLGTDTYISVEGLPKVAAPGRECSAALFLDRVKALNVNEGQMVYSLATSTGAAAGNRYEEAVFALPGTNPCIAVRYYIHYGVFENYPPGAVQRFDGQALVNQFDAIRRTLVIVQ